MAGPWFVDPENGSESNNGLSPAAPWKLIPGQTGATAQTGYGVVAGDTINVRNGTTSTLQLIPPVATLTYRGYGLADNVLMLRIPSAWNPRFVLNVRVVREVGAHEGMWIIAGVAETICINTQSRSGYVFEDMHVIGSAAQTGAVLMAAASTHNAANLTVRRSHITGGAAHGIAAYCKNVTIEDSKVSYPGSEGITLLASVSNGYRAGSVDVIRRVEIVEPSNTTAVGDGIEVVTQDERNELSLLVDQVYIRKNNPYKHAMVLQDGFGGITVRNFHIDSDDASAAGFLIATVRGSISVSNGYVRGGAVNNALLRTGIGTGSVVMATGSTLRINNVLHDAQTHSGFFHSGAAESASTHDGVMTITHCQQSGVNTQAFGFSGGISVHAGTTVTYGANAAATIKNNVMTATGKPGIKLPVGGGGAARWDVANNLAAEYGIGAATYATAALFETAHLGGAGNLSSDPMLSSSLRPLPGSPLIGAGTHLGYTRDLAGVQRPNPPSIGAYDMATLRVPA